MKTKTQKGFSLIELMIVVAIIGVLAAIAMPNYNQYVTRSRITEGVAGLSDARVRQRPGLCLDRHRHRIDDGLHLYHQPGQRPYQRHRRGCGVAGGGGELLDDQAGRRLLIP